MSGKKRELAHDPADPMDYGIYFDYDDLCYGNYDNSTTLVGDVTVTNNRFLQYDAAYIYYNDIGYYLEDYSTLEVGDLIIAIM